MPQIVYIKEAKGMAYEHKTSTVLVDPSSGLWVEEGEWEGFIQSPALGFIHELIHAWHHLRDPESYFKYRKPPKYPFKGESGNRYSTFEEWETIFLERMIATELGEPRRFSSRGIPVIVKGPTSREERK
jgi:hypothetical protein